MRASQMWEKGLFDAIFSKYISFGGGKTDCRVLMTAFLKFCSELDPLFTYLNEFLLNLIWEKVESQLQKLT